MKIPKLKRTATGVVVNNLFAIDFSKGNHSELPPVLAKIASSRLRDQLVPTYTGDSESGLCHESNSIFEWNTADLKREIAEYVVQGRLSSDLLDNICVEGACAPIEFESLDYKEDVDESPYGKAKLILKIVSFYNSFGGYLLFGVRETEPEIRFQVIGFDAKKIDIESIKASIKAYTGERIQIAAAPIPVRVGDRIEVVFALHVPQRPFGLPPLHFVKDGAGADNVKKTPAFFRESVYCRRGDECVEAKGPKIIELNAERSSPYLSQNGIALPASFRKTRIQHNLPDRNFVCANFVGRESVLGLLWRWLGDDLSHMKVLAGEGGLGKSSIAYEFAERVSETPGVSFEQVVWLTAKEQQFRAFEDQYVNVPERHFSSYEELLSALCTKLPFTPAELEGATATELKRMFKSGLADTPSLVIIDDVDSLQADEQKRVFELGAIIGVGKSRLLLTTRFNQSVSSDNVVKLEGLTMPEEFPQYMETLRERLQFAPLADSEIVKIHQVSGGSPLFSESLVRLLKWYSVGEAIAHWQGEKGIAVRDAALKREIHMLTTEARRILLAVAMLGEASAIELCEALGYPSEMIERSLSELEALFLIAAPTLASVRRFRIPDNTRRLVQDHANDLITDNARLEKDISKFRKNALRTPTRDTRVALAISQAASYVRVGNLTTAMSTIKEARRKTQDHFDLLSYQASLHMKEVPPQADNARKLAREAINKGARKNEVFSCWFDAEWAVGHYVGALEAAEAALLFKASGAFDWQVRKSAALASKASDQAEAGSYSTAVNTMLEASTALQNIISAERSESTDDWKEQQYKLHDQVWLWAGSDEKGTAKTSAQLGILQKFWHLGDFRITNLRRVLSTMDTLASAMGRQADQLTNAQKTFCGVLIQKSVDLFNKRAQRFPSDVKHQELVEKLDTIRLKIQTSLDKAR